MQRAYNPSVGSTVTGNTRPVRSNRTASAVLTQVQHAHEWEKGFKMATAMGLKSGPHMLTASGVNAAVLYKSPGAYALGKMGTDGIFYIDYVGRSDDDVAGRLKQHIPEAYQQFFFGYYRTAQAAYEKECWLYHTFRPADNVVHPAKPKNSRSICPECGYAG